MAGNEEKMNELLVRDFSPRHMKRLRMIVERRKSEGAQPELKHTAAKLPHPTPTLTLTPSHNPHNKLAHSLNHAGEHHDQDGTHFKADQKNHGPHENAHGPKVKGLDIR